MIKPVLLSAYCFYIARFDDLEDFSMQRPAGTIFCMLKMPLYSLIGSGVFRHFMCQMPLLIYLHNLILYLDSVDLCDKYHSL